MKKIIKLTESDLEKIVLKILSKSSNVLKEQSSNNIVEIQKELDKRGYNIGPSGVDGVYGNNTKNAVIQFQKDNKIKPTGYVGPITSKALGTQPLSKKPTTDTTTQKKKTSNLNLTSKDTILSPNIDTEFKSKFDINKLSPYDSTYVCKAGQKNCGQFVNDFSKKLAYVGNAWLAHDLDQVGRRVWSSYTSLSPNQVQKITNIFNTIQKQGGPKENGPQSENIKKLQQELLKDVSPSNLKVDDIVGIYYPKSSHHEEAFDESGKPYFTKGPNGTWVKGTSLSSGKGFGLNTHVGIVGGVKNGVPLIFHNISGDVYSDPYNKLRGGGKIAWIKRN